LRFRIRDGARGGTPRERRAGVWCGHAKGSELGAGSGLSPTRRSRINRSTQTLPAKHCFSGLPEFYSWRRYCVALFHP
jgi:hypothetical protein